MSGLTGETILIRLEGEPDFTPDAAQFGGWPPPEQFVYAEDGTGGFGFTSPEVAALAGHKVLKTWEKVSQSGLTDEQASEMPYVMRGAEYRLVGDV